MNYDFNWAMLTQQPFRAWILNGFFTTVHLALVSWSIALALGIAVATLRVTESKWVRAIGTSYVEVFRNIPLLVQLFFWFFVIPTLLPQDWKFWWNRLPDSPYYSAVIGLSLFTAARVAEPVRSGISAVPKGQYRAALSTGLSVIQMYRYVILPYAVRIVIPPLASEFLTIFKNTALAMTINVAEITFAARSIESRSFHGIEAYTVASAVYILTTASVVLFMRWLEKKLKIPGMIAAKQ